VTHCRKCGAELVPVTRPTSRHDVFTGALTQHEWDVCPNWRPRWVFGNGHDWWHRGTNPIDRVMPHRPDPMIHENPPRPPVVR
jgi:hypothetical protein